MTTPNALTEYMDTTMGEITFSDLLVTDCNQRAARSFVEKYHYSGGMGNAAMPVALYHQPSSRLLGVIAFHTPISENTRRSIFGKGNENAVTELHRMAIHSEAPHNTGSWFISRALDWLKSKKPQYKAVISFADQTEGHDGTVYQAANADYYGTSDARTYYEDQEGVLRAPRQCGENVSKADARERGWSIVEREAKHRYVFWLPDEYESKDQLRENAQIELQPYP